MTKTPLKLSIEVIWCEVCVGACLPSGLPAAHLCLSLTTPKYTALICIALMTQRNVDNTTTHPSWLHGLFCIQTTSLSTYFWQCRLVFVFKCFFYIKQGVALKGRNTTGPPCSVTDCNTARRADDDRRQRPLLVCPPYSTPCEEAQ